MVTDILGGGGSVSLIHTSLPNPSVLDKYIQVRPSPVLIGLRQGIRTVVSSISIIHFETDLLRVRNGQAMHGVLGNHENYRPVRQGGHTSEVNQLVHTKYR